MRNHLTLSFYSMLCDYLSINDFFSLVCRDSICQEVSVVK